ncbi:MAG: FAD:protein FMN transferase [Candidatus Levybacteria bacterium]|nr:FAD:protein FMN transferase [Candidatus Levybacteria bacterium]
MKPFQCTFEAIGTVWVIDVFDALSRTDQEHIISQVHKRIEEYDLVYSRFRKESLVSTMARKEGEYTMPKDAKELFTLYRKLYDISEGAFTPLIGNVLHDTGYDAEYSLKPKEVIRPVPTWDATFDFRYPKLIMKKPAILDFGAAGKGHLVDQVGRVLELSGISSYCVDAGGDMLYKSLTKEPMRIGLEHPANPKQVIGVVTVENGSICGSAGNRRKWDQYNHILNPHTRTSPTDILSVWVLAKKTILADALATALYFTSADQLSEQFEFEYAMLYKDYSLRKSDTFPGEIFYK